MPNSRTTPEANLVMTLLDDAAQRAQRYLQTLNERPVGPRAETVAALEALDITLPDEGTDAQSVLAALDEIGSPATVASNHGRFFGFVIGGSLPVTTATHWLASAWDQNAGLWAGSPVTARLEEIALRWLCDILDVPSTWGGAFVTGATMANFTALAAGRRALYSRLGHDVDRRGLFEAPPIDVWVGGEAHPSVTKALGLLGLGRERLTSLAVDDQGRVIADAIPTVQGPTLVCLQAGNVNTGAFDPIAEVLARIDREQCWVHVDAAFGFWAAAVPELAHWMAGADTVDSICTDAHKWLNVPYDSGITLVADPEVLRGAMAYSTAYLPENERREPSHYTPELSRSARGVNVWAALRHLGRRGLAVMVLRCCRHAKRFAEGLSEAGFEVLNDVVLNQVLVSFGDAQRTLEVIRRIQDDGTCWTGSTVWQGRTAMRISVCSHATTDEDVERSLAAMLRCAEVNHE